jgi:hypothetical protein
LASRLIASRSSPFLSHGHNAMRDLVTLHRHQRPAALGKFGFNLSKDTVEPAKVFVIE